MDELLGELIFYPIHDSQQNLGVLSGLRFSQTFPVCNSLPPLKTLCRRPGTQHTPTTNSSSASLPILRTGFCSFVLAVSEKLKDVHFDLGLAQPLWYAVDAVLGQGDGEPFPSAALHGVIQDSSCGQVTIWRQLICHPPPLSIHPSSPLAPLTLPLSFSSQLPKSLSTPDIHRTLQSECRCMLQSLVTDRAMDSMA